MPTTVDRGKYAVDTSVAVAALDAAHAAHPACREVVQRYRPALAGQAGFETFAVLTRMPGELVVDPSTAAQIMARVFPESVWLTPEQSSALLTRLGTAGVTGGAVYDALVGAAAQHSGRTLLTRDRRAGRTYEFLGVAHEFVGP